MMREQREQRLDRLERFERGVVFRVARGYFLVMAVLGVLACLGGAVTLGLGLWRPALPEPAPPPPLHEPGPLTLTAVEAWQKERERAAARPEREGRPAAAPVQAQKEEDPAQAARRELEQILGQLRALFPAPAYTWDDVYEERCKVPSSYGCLQTERHLSRAGVPRLLQEALRGTPDGDVLPVLRALAAVLGQAPAERRGALLPTVVGAYRSIWRAYHEQRRAREAAIEEARQAHERRVREQDEEKARLRTAGLYGAASGMGLLVLVSLFLTHFAIERHLRLVRGLMAGASRSSAAPRSGRAGTGDSPEIAAPPT
jgi:PAS domain-containing protein